MAIPTAWISPDSVPSGAGLHPLARPRVHRSLTPVAYALSLVTNRPSHALWLRAGLGVLLAVGAFSLIAPPRVLGEGSADLEANGGKPVDIVLEMTGATHLAAVTLAASFAATLTATKVRSAPIYDSLRARMLQRLA